MEIRFVEESEYRQAVAMFAQTLLHGPPSDEDWELARRGYQPKRVFGAFDGGQIVGLARSVDTRMTVPGGASVPTAAITGVGVRSSHTRRGVMTALKRAQLDELAARGVTVAALHASEALIYGRFGYGVATLERTLKVHARRARVREDAPSGGDVVVHDLDDAVDRMPDVYAACAPSRTGMIERPDAMWPHWQRTFRKREGSVRLAEHRDPDGVTRGYAMYAASDPWPEEGIATMVISDMVTTTPESFAELWRYLTSVDMVNRIELRGRPVDEPVDLLMTDPRTVSTTSMDDDVWLRLVDVPGALNAREYGGSRSVVIDVEDAFLPANTGRYEVGPDGARRSDKPADASMDVATLAMLYLGGRRASTLVETGWIRARDTASAEALDHLFATKHHPWCGTFF